MHLHHDFAQNDSLLGLVAAIRREVAVIPRPEYDRSLTHAFGHIFAGGYAAGYYSYFGPAAGNSSKGYYSFDLGAWHIIALNANCTYTAGGCGSGSSEDLWLRADPGPELRAFLAAAR